MVLASAGQYSGLPGEIMPELIVKTYIVNGKPRTKKYVKVNRFKKSNCELTFARKQFA